MKVERLTRTGAVLVAVVASSACDAGAWRAPAYGGPPPRRIAVVAPSARPARHPAGAPARLDGAADAPARLDGVKDPLVREALEIAIALGSQPEAARPLLKPLGDFLWRLDRGSPKVSAIARAVFVASCRPKDALTIALCGPDARRLDRAALDAELAALGVDPGTRSAVVRTHALAARLASELPAAVDVVVQRVDSDDGKASLRRRLVDAPEAAYARWQASVYDPNRAAFEAAYDVEEKVARGAEREELAGCGAALRAALSRHVFAEADEQSLKNLERRLLDPVGLPLFTAIETCDRAERRDAAAAVDDATLAVVYAPHRGPRIEALLASAVDPEARSANASPFEESRLCNTMMRCDMGTYYSWGNVRRPHDPTRAVAAKRWPARPFRGRENAQIASLGPQGDHVLVTFTDREWTTPLFSCTSTGRVVGWDWTPTGARLAYAQHCVRSGVERHVAKNAPVLIRADLAAALRPGHRMSYLRVQPEKAGPDEAAPDVVTAADGAFVMVHGIARPAAP